MKKIYNKKWWNFKKRMDSEHRSRSGKWKCTGSNYICRFFKNFKFGNNYIVIVENPVKYASYVEYGHRQEPGRYVPALGKRLKQSWVEGKYMLTISEKELESQLPAILEQK